MKPFLNSNIKHIFLRQVFTPLNTKLWCKLEKTTTENILYSSLESKLYFPLLQQTDVQLKNELSIKLFSN